MDYTSAVATILKEKKIIASPSSYISIWTKWYKGKVPSFHRYYVYNGSKKIYKERASMKMAKQVCEDWASLLMNEKVKIVVADQEQMDNLLMDLDFWNKANEAVEKGFALSMSALVVDISGLEIEEDEFGNGYVASTENAKLELNLHTASHIIPITWENGQCVECGFATEDTDKTVVIAHLRDEDGTYNIYKKIEYKNGNKKPDEFVFMTGSKTPLYSLIYPRITNNLEVDSPLPISIFGNSIDTLKSIDVKYDSYNIEFMQGKKRTYVSAELNEVDKETGEVKSTFDPDDTVIYRLPPSSNINGETKAAIVNVTDALRSQEHGQAIQDELNYLSKQVGLGVDYYRFEKGRVMTATQVISEKSDTFRNMKKHEGILEKAIISLMKSIMYMSNEFTDIKFDKPEEVSISFDDSIIEDKSTEKDNDRKDLEAGIMSKIQFRMKWYGEDEETARKELETAYGDVDLIQRINSYLPALEAGAISYLEFVKRVYIDMSEQEQKALAEELQSQGSITPDMFGGYRPNSTQINNE